MHLLKAQFITPFNNFIYSPIEVNNESGNFFDKLFFKELITTEGMNVKLA